MAQCQCQPWMAPAATPPERALEGLWERPAARAKGFMPHEEGMALHQAGLAAVAPGPFLEIGTYCGKSAVYLGAAAREKGRVLFSVDHHRGSEELQPGWADHDPEVLDPGTGVIDTLPWARRTLREAGLESHVVLVVGPSEVVARYWAVPLSLLFIDGGHGREVVRADFEAWVPKVAPGGTLAVHDVFADPAEGGQAPYELYCEVLASGEFEEVKRVGSLRLLRRSQAPT
jgi:predicted O-methyltransferase YrrM